MNRCLLSVLLIVLLSVAGSAQSAGVAIAYFDPERLTSKGKKVELYDFKYFLPLIEQVAKRDFPNVEFRIIDPSEMVILPDGTRLSVATAKAPLGIVLSVKGKKRVEMRGVQTDNDFGCAASAFFGQPSKACLKKKK